jgi:putative transposase
VRHGHLPEREIMTGIGPVAVRQPRVRDREANGSERIRFSPTILPPYARRTKSLEVLIPILYLKGISTGDFEEALAALLGKDAGGLALRGVEPIPLCFSFHHERRNQQPLAVLVAPGRLCVDEFGKVFAPLFVPLLWLLVPTQGV